MMAGATSQNWANTLWACAHLGVGDAAIINAGAAAMGEMGSRCNPQDISNALWALATLGVRDASALSKLVRAMGERAGSSKPQEVSNALQALGSLKWYDAAVHSQLMAAQLRMASSSNPQDLSNALFSCALVCHSDRSTDALALHVSNLQPQQLEQWTAQAVADTAFAWAVLSAVGVGSSSNSSSSSGIDRMAQRLLAEAARRGHGGFSGRVDSGRH